MPLPVRKFIDGALDAALRFAMNIFIGCKIGACPIATNPLVAMVIHGLGQGYAVLRRLLPSQRKLLQADKTTAYPSNHRN